MRNRSFVYASGLHRSRSVTLSKCHPKYTGKVDRVSNRLAYRYSLWISHSGLLNKQPKVRPHSPSRLTVGTKIAQKMKLLAVLHKVAGKKKWFLNIEPLVVELRALPILQVGSSLLFLSSLNFNFVTTETALSLLRISPVFHIFICDAFS